MEKSSVPLLLMTSKLTSKLRRQTRSLDLWNSSKKANSIVTILTSSLAPISFSRLLPCPISCCSILRLPRSLELTIVPKTWPFSTANWEKWVNFCKFFLKSLCEGSFWPGQRFVRLQIALRFQIVSGKVAPVLEGVTIRIFGKDKEAPIHTLVTDKDGTYRVGPLDGKVEYTWVQRNFSRITLPLMNFQWFLGETEWRGVDFYEHHNFLVLYRPSENFSNYIAIFHLQLGEKFQNVAKKIKIWRKTSKFPFFTH